MKTATAPDTKDLFGTTIKTGKAKAEKKIFDAPTLGDKIARFNVLKETIETAKGELEMIEGDIKQFGKKLFLNDYKTNRLRPDSFKIRDKAGALAMYIAQDRYLTVDEVKADILRQYEGLLEEKKTYVINPLLVEKYKALISRMIMNSKEIEESEKPILIQGVSQFAVKPGSIDRLLQYKEPEKIFELIAPVVALKRA